MNLKFNTQTWLLLKENKIKLFMVGVLGGKFAKITLNVILKE